MYWCVHIISILIMIAVLQIDPAYIQALSVHTKHSDWQLVSYIALAIILLIISVRYLTRLKSSHNNQANSCSLAAPSTPSINSIVISCLLSILWMIPLVVALLSNALAQRLLLAEQSIHSTVYVEAWVTPVGLSDRQLELTPQKNDKDQVTQGYRLLAELSQISPYYHTDPTLNTHDKYHSQPKNIFNPFAITTNTADHSTTNLSATQTALPQKMRVLLTSFNSNHAWLNELKPNESVYLKLALHPLNIPNTHSKREFNQYRWLSSRHATATATMLNTNSHNNADTVQTIHHLSGFNLQRSLNLQRYRLRAHLQQLYQSQASTQADNEWVEQSNQLYDSNRHNSATQQQAMAVTLSLLTGDRSLINKDTTALYRFGGIAHLLAISGAHVLFLAILAAWLATGLINLSYPKLYRHISRWQVQLIVAVIVAFIYALFSGFDVPAVRTALMLLLLGVVRYLLLSRATFKLLITLAVLMAWQDVFVLWQAGFWLSFVAVALLVAYSYRIQHSINVDKQTQNYHLFMATYSKQNSRHKHIATTSKRSLTSKTALPSDSPLTMRLINCTYRNLRQFILLQLWMTIALLPISLWLFAEVSLWGILVNMFAIAFFGWIVVPLNLLAGLIYSVAIQVSVFTDVGTVLADTIWQLLFTLLQHFHAKLIQLQTATAHTGWLFTPISLPILMVSLLVVLPWLLPKGLLSRLLSMPAILLLVFMLITQSNHQDLLAHDKNSPTLIITPLSVDISAYKYADLSATLLTTPFDSWLLLSDYPRVNNDTRPTDTSTDESNKGIQAQAISDALYNSLKQYQITQLTGVIVQTPSQHLSSSIQLLEDRLSIQYYWQAGSQHLLSATIDPSTTMPLNTKLIMQSCDIGRSWHTDTNTTGDKNQHNGIRNDYSNKYSHGDNDTQLNSSNPYAVKINALTGWQDINDSAVWSCALQIQTHYPVYLSHRANESLIKNRLEVTHKPNQTKIVVNSAQHDRLWQLWSMVCPVADIALLSPNSIESRSQRLSSHHWLSPKLAVLHQDQMKQISPLSLTVLGDGETHIEAQALY